ncbi:ATP synthase F1 subunit gamma [Helcococcus kunzii]|uniref:ATP synthase F1 subunit gamma n=1 Tax=Helcococcus kunzii TaxID=40091 RepID=UPI001C94B616|nr:ATP synthase F1 subunit gamma [Helcococcus kunzii]MCT1795631.1 ATP synthase F1 subunit gamma [Helcococcus kunzii]MCT1988803.1 ATP synthase F1 subunit gamma [Helcococcus kunzii]QZO77315.1 ATP synthase F1 subunit gamma [Helcococcus kunzii]
MSSTKEIKSRIKSINDTRKITNAMYLISSTKIKKAKLALDETRPYFYALRTEIKRIFRTIKDLEHKYLYPINMDNFVDGDNGFLVITADKGLAGPYNSNVIKKTMEIAKETAKLYVVGEYGRHHLKRHGVKIVDDFNYSAQTPTLEEARQIAKILIDEYNSGVIKKLFIVYTDFDGKVTTEAKLTRLLPFHRDYFDAAKKEAEEDVHNEFNFTSDVGELLDDLAENYIVGFIYSALVDSYCSELNYRMNAMNSANQNADKILETLSLEYNRVRQSSITQEIIEVSSGAKVMKRKRKKAKNNETTR